MRASRCNNNIIIYYRNVIDAVQNILTRKLRRSTKILRVYHKTKKFQFFFKLYLRNKKTFFFFYKWT